MNTTINPIIKSLIREPHSTNAPFCGENDYNPEKINNEFFVDIPDGKIHVYTYDVVTNYNENKEPDRYCRFINIDYIYNEGKRARITEATYEFFNTYEKDENGNFIWKELLASHFDYPSWSSTGSDKNRIEQIESLLCKSNNH